MFSSDRLAGGSGTYRVLARAWLRRRNPLFDPRPQRRNDLVSQTLHLVWCVVAQPEQKRREAVRNELREIFSHLLGAAGQSTWLGRGVFVDQHTEVVGERQRIGLPTRAQRRSSDAV